MKGVWKSPASETMSTFLQTTVTLLGLAIPTREKGDEQIGYGGRKRCFI